MSDRQFSSIVVLIIFQIYADDREDEWIMMKRKTLKYLSANSENNPTENQALETKLKTFLKSEISISVFL